MFLCYTHKENISMRVPYHVLFLIRYTRTLKKLLDTLLRNAYIQHSLLYGADAICPALHPSQGTISSTSRTSTYTLCTSDTCIVNFYCVRHSKRVIIGTNLSIKRRKFNLKKRLRCTKKYSIFQFIPYMAISG